MRRDVEPAERDALTTLALGDGWSGVVWSRLDESNADAAITKLVARLLEFDGHAEWKLYGYDRPDDLAQRLVAAGLEPQDQEAVVVAELCELDLDASLPVGGEGRGAGERALPAFWGWCLRGVGSCFRGGGSVSRGPRGWGACGVAERWRSGVGA